MGLALYRKYRPTGFSGVVGQDAIIKTLCQAIKSGKISHAYLFSGPRGVGKTSVARILAHEINNLKYSDESVHLDIIEIDAASNNGVEDVRELRDKVQITPSSAKFKVYIIDEVHMLSKAAFNALLKTLEEPPEHCVFILATTEIHKLPETIISRTQRFSFKPMNQTDAVKKIAEIAKLEGIKISDDAMELLAEHSDGSFRDSLSLLDQLSSSGTEITRADVEGMLGLPTKDVIEKVYLALLSANSAQIFEAVKTIRSEALNPTQIAKELSKHIRMKLISGEITKLGWAPRLLKKLLSVGMSKHPADTLEIILFDAIENTSPQSEAKIETSDTIVEHPEELPAKTPVIKPARKNTSNKQSFSVEDWPTILDLVKKNETKLYSILRLAKVSENDSMLFLTFDFPLHQKKMSLADNLSKLQQIITDEFGSAPDIECALSQNRDLKNKKIASNPSEEKIDDGVKNISNIFGSAEVLES